MGSVSDQINTTAQEFEPIITADDKMMYFTGRARGDNLGGEDIFVSVRNEEGEWGKPKIVPGVSTKSDNESTESISVDGTASPTWFYSDETNKKSTGPILGHAVHR